MDERGDQSTGDRVMKAWTLLLGFALLRFALLMYGGEDG